MIAPNNNSRNAPAAPIKGIDDRLWCPACRGSLHRTRTPERCPECLQPLWIEIPAKLAPTGIQQHTEVNQ